MTDLPADLFKHPRFPRASAYDPAWIAQHQMGPNVLWLAEFLSEEIPLEPGRRVLDLGCGTALSSIFFAREFGVTVFATDLWIRASENWSRVVESKLTDKVYPIRSEARALPFAEGFFDTIVALDSFPYFGTDDLYLSYLVRFLRPGGTLGIVAPGLMQEIGETVPEHLTRPQANGCRFWEPEHWSFHTKEWWRRHWSRTGLVDVTLADVMPEGWRAWQAHEEAVERSGKGIFPSCAEALENDGGRYLGFVRVIAKRKEVDKFEIGPHVWEPEFSGVCSQLRDKREDKSTGPG